MSLASPYLEHSQPHLELLIAQEKVLDTENIVLSCKHGILQTVVLMSELLHDHVKISRHKMYAHDYMVA